jgi:antimicrobial peptide system SdpB family protein
MIKQRLLGIENYCQNLSVNYAPHTNVLGLARSVLACGTLLTLICNPAHYFFNKSTEGVYFNPLLDFTSFPLNRLNFFFLFGVDNAPIMKWVGVLALLIVISGYFIRVTSVIHWWIALSFMLGSSLLDGGDQIASIMSFLLIPICLTDNRKNHWFITPAKQSPANIIAILFIWLVRLQVAVIYLDAAVGKFAVTEWKNGTALYYWLNHSVFGFPDLYKPILDRVLANTFLQPGLTYGVLILELCLFLALTASERYRKILFPIAVGFHFFIILFHGIFSFFFSIAAGLILYLLPTYRNIKWPWQSIK